MGELRDDYRILDKAIEDDQRRLDWKLKLRRNARALEGLADIVRLGAGWDDSCLFRWEKGAPYRLPLALVASHKSHAEARQDLYRIMDALHCGAMIYAPTTLYNPGGIGTKYTGDGKLGQLKVKITIEAKYVPPGCKVTVVQPYQKWHREYNPSHYHVQCAIK